MSLYCFLARELAGDLGNNCEVISIQLLRSVRLEGRLTVQSNDAEDENERENENDDGIDLETG